MMHADEDRLVVWSVHSLNTCRSLAFRLSILMPLLLCSRAGAQETPSGRVLYQELIGKYGVVSTTRWTESLERVTGELASVSDPLNDHYEVAVLEAPDIYNAAALDGGYVVIFSGFLELFDALLEEEGVTPVTRSYSQSLDTFLAPIVSHEVAHLLLGHSIPEKERPSQGTRHEVEVFLEERQIERGDELEADRLGALLMVRAGYRLDAMYLLFMIFDEMVGDRFAASELTYLRTHPRPTDREANLDIWKGELKRNQARIDDAVTLIQNNVALDVAIALLDTTLTYFPQLVSLRHDRATAWHRVWLNTLTVNEQTPATSFRLYAPDIVEILRGGQEDEQAYRQTVADYAYVVERYTAPRTMSQLAALVASGGDFQGAAALAEKAMSAGPDDPVVLANVSAVHLYAKRYQEAYEHARRAVETFRAQPDEQNYAALAPSLYNLGLSAKALGKLEESRRAFEAYAQIDSTSRFAQLAATHVGKSLLGQNRRLDLRDDFELVGGVRIGASGTEIENALGLPEFVDEVRGVEILAYPSEGLSIHLSGDECVLIMVREPFDGSYRGIKLGDTRARVLEALGQPQSVAASGWLDYAADDLGVRVDKDRVTGLLIRG